MILLETGSRIPADCVLISGQDLTVDESIYKKDDEKEARPTKKYAVNEENYGESPDPFLLSNTLISTGVGKAVI